MVGDKKPATQAGYTPEWVEAVRKSCLYVATVLGDYLEEHLAVVGGLVPGLLIDQGELPRGADPHPGTMDLDLGLQLGVFEGRRYREISRRLRDAGFEMDANEEGNNTRQRWKIVGSAGEAVVDFLIPPDGAEDSPGSLKDLEEDFAAIITPGLELAFRDRELIRVAGTTINGERSIRDIPVCGPGAFVVLKALAFDVRGLNKDAFDLFYVVRNFGTGPADVAARLRPLLDSTEARQALDILERDFSAADATGPMRVAAFTSTADDEGLREDVVGFVAELLDVCS